MPREEYYREKCRLQSFLSFPKTVNVGVVLLAKAGFWYTGNNDEVVCFSCGIHLDNWSPGKNPFVRHQEEWPDCDFVNWRDERNVPYGSTENPFDPNSRNNEAPGLVATMVDGLDQIDFPAEVDPVMCVELSRIKTYTGWPASAPVFPDELASNGFFYTGSEDRVKCAFCAVILRDWEPSDRVVTEHRSHSPACIFVRNPNSRSNGNIPLGCESLSEVDQLVNIAPNTADVLSDSGMAATLGIDVERPRTPHYSQFDRRLDSFKEWPATHCQNKRDLAEAGFYFIGNGDNVKCFFCDGGLRNWEPQDDPITEHARWFPRCSYVRQRMGIKFIRNITEHFDQFYPELIPTDQRTTATTDVVNISGSAEALLDAVMKIEEGTQPLDTLSRVPSDGCAGSTQNTEGMLSGAIGGWPTSPPVFTNESRRNAFFFTGSEDRIKCAFCATILHDWEVSDHYATKHPLRLPTCTYASSLNTNSNLNVRPGSLAPASNPSGAEYTVEPREIKACMDTDRVRMVLDIGHSKIVVQQAIENQLKRHESLNSHQWTEGFLTEEEKKEQLLIENRHLKDQRQCKICMDNEFNMVFLPCGHLVCCQECGLELWTCPICRKAIEGTVKAVMCPPYIL